MGFEHFPHSALETRPCILEWNLWGYFQKCAGDQIHPVAVSLHVDVQGPHRGQHSGAASSPWVSVQQESLCSGQFTYLLRLKCIQTIFHIEATSQLLYECSWQSIFIDPWNTVSYVTCRLGLRHLLNSGKETTKPYKDFSILYRSFVMCTLTRICLYNSRGQSRERWQGKASSLYYCVEMKDTL